MRPGTALPAAVVVVPLVPAALGIYLVGANASARRLFEITRNEFLLDDPDTADVLSRFVGSESRGTGQALAAALNVDARVA